MGTTHPDFSNRSRSSASLESPWGLAAGLCRRLGALFGGTRRCLLGSLGMVVLAAGLAGCGGGADRTKAQLRLINASAYAALDLRVDDQLRFSGVVYGQAPGYQEIDPEETDSSLSRTGSSTALVSLTPALVRKQHYSLMAWGAEGKLKTVLLDEDVVAADGGKAKLRVLNTAADAGAVDIYLTAEGESLADAVALESGAAVGTLGKFASVSSGSWRLRITGAGSKTDLRLDLTGLNLASTAVYTLIVTPASGGVLVNALLMPQQGALAVHDVAHARVRVAAALPDSDAVSVELGATLLMPETSSPAIGNYAFVPAGEQLLRITAAGVALPPSPVRLAPGDEHTLLIHAANAVPAASWIREDNRRPLATGYGKLRLVNGLAASAQSLSLTADALPVASAIAPGSGSIAAEVAAGTGIDLAVRAAGAGAPLFQADDQTLEAEAVYTVFVLGGPTASGFVRRDR